MKQLCDFICEAIKPTVSAELGISYKDAYKSHDFERAADILEEIYNKGKRIKLMLDTPVRGENIKIYGLKRMPSGVLAVKFTANEYKDYEFYVGIRKLVGKDARIRVSKANPAFSIKISEKDSSKFFDKFIKAICKPKKASKVTKTTKAIKTTKVSDAPTVVNSIQTTKEVKHTESYFKEMISAHLSKPDYSKLRSVLAEFIEKYGRKINSNNNTYEFTTGVHWRFWSTTIEGCEYIKDSDTLYLYGYWQSDSTDGTDIIRYDDFVRSKSYRVNGRTYELEEFTKLLKYLADDYLSGESVAKRNEAKRIQEMKIKVKTIADEVIDPLYNDLKRRFGNFPNNGMNGKRAVSEWIDKNIERLVTYSESRLRELVLKVYNANCKFDDYFYKTSYSHGWQTRTKIRDYDLDF